MSNVPAYLLNRQSRGLSAAISRGLGGNSPPHISIRGNRFTLVDAAGNEQQHDRLSLRIVIVDGNENVSKIFYKDAYDPQATDFKPPTCFSDNGVGPSAQSQEPQHTNCATCPRNVWGSATSKVTGKQTKECNDLKKIAVIVPEYAATGIETVFLLRVPPNSLKNLKAYAISLAGSSIGDRPVDPMDVVTEISFDPSTQGTLLFKGASWVDEDTLPWIDRIVEEDKTGILVGKDDQVYQGRHQIAQQPLQERTLAPGAGPAAPMWQRAAEVAGQQPQAAQDAPRGRGRPVGTTKGPKTAPSPAQTAQTTVQERTLAPGAGPAAPMSVAEMRQRLAEMEAAENAKEAPLADNEVPAFLRRDNAAPQQVAAQTNNGNGQAGATFGIVNNPSAPDAGLSAAIANAFKLPV